MGEQAPTAFEIARDQGVEASAEARETAARAHLLAGLACLFCCTSFFIPIAAVFYAGSQYKERPKSPYALYHLNQAFVFQVTVLFTVIVVFMLVYVVSTIGTVARIDVFASGLPYLLLAIPWLAGSVLPLTQVGKARAGRWEGYPILAEKVLRMRAPIFK